MAYLKPPAFVRKVFNKLAMKFAIGGAQVLAVAARKSGLLQKIPVIPVQIGGTTYIVSSRGESDWVKNLRAAGRGELIHKGSATPFTATEVPAGEREAILDEYRKKAGRAVKPLFQKLPDPADHPVFKLA